ncbi:helix-turn-helix domain-containing protein [Rugosimonospora africana]|uniref:Helix-turn-helix domain-containing protein n=1 Tax=Rugosimonospora africana TaxID=556532 RepID=A0A8J3QYB5_9ACTN|nr:helix-turn-helix domain-containing protein [Rugosimonospora africana]GIH19650.1 hypothetical protein Raf01_78220 [Rugosimonospora africana]
MTDEQWIELRGLTNSPDVAATVATRARIVLWHNEGERKKDIAALAGVSRPTVDLWLGRYAAGGVAGYWTVHTPHRVSSCQLGSERGYWP